MKLSLYVIVFLISSCHAVQEDKTYCLSMDLNPSCDPNVCRQDIDTISLFSIDITADESNEFLNSESDDKSEHHWIWSVLGFPGIQAAITGQNDKLLVNWNGLIGSEDPSDSITFENLPTYTSAILLFNLIEYNDINNTGQLNSSNVDSIAYPLNGFSWHRHIIENTTGRVAVGFVGKNFSLNSSFNNSITNGIINLTLSAYAIDGLGLWLPHLSHSDKTSQVDIQLDRLETNSGFKNSRFGLELVIVSDSPQDANFTHQSTTTLDDENTPGIFTTQELIIPGHNDSSLQTYLQWRPVVYTTRQRELSTSSGISMPTAPFRMLQNVSDKLADTILYNMYGERLNELLVMKLNVSFGSPKDGFYNKSCFQAWTFTLGLGTPIHNGLSPFMILIMCLMMGSLLIFVVAILVFYFVQWRRRRQQPNPRAHHSTTNQGSGYSNI